jgi:hypothetical protein
MVEDLLKPSLQATGPAIAIYSIRASFFVAFFGGPLGIVLFTALNARRLDRLRKDGPWLMIGGAIAIGAMLAQIFLLDTAREGGSGLVTSQNLRIANRALALLLCGAFYLMHRAQYRSMQFLGLESPDPWVPGFVCALLGVGISTITSIIFRLGING